MAINNQFWWLKSDKVDGLQYDIDLKKWIPYKNYEGRWYPGTYPCKSYKAAVRHLKKHNEIPKGTRFILVSQYVGCNRILIKK